MPLIHLRFSLEGNHGSKYMHAQDRIEQLGITYTLAVPQSVYNCWWFLDCQNVPEELPSYLTVMKGFKPHRQVGNGLSKKDVKLLRKRKHECKS